MNCCHYPRTQHSFGQFKGDLPGACPSLHQSSKLGVLLQLLQKRLLRSQDLVLINKLIYSYLCRTTPEVFSSGGRHY